MIVNLIENTYSSAKTDICGDFVNSAFIFSTNAAEFVIHYEIENILYKSLSHVGITAREGLAVMYRRSSDVTWLTIDVFSRSQSEKVDMRHLVQNNETYDVLIYGPLFAGLKRLDVEFDDSCFLRQSEWKSFFSRHSVLCIGGVHTVGIGCTTASLSLPQTILRRIGCRTDIIAFNKYNHLELALRELHNLKEKRSLGSYDLILLEGDHIRQEDSAVDDFLHKTIKEAFRLSDKVLLWACIPDAAMMKKERLQTTADEFRTKRKKYLKYMDVSDCYGDNYSDMCTFSNNFINETGRMFIFKEMEPVITDLLR